MRGGAYSDGTMRTLFENYGEEADWADLCAAFPVLAPLADCPQDPRHHGEGDVATHTRMVLDELMRDGAYRALGEDDRFLLFWAAVFHDVGKPARTVVEGDGAITSRGHSRTGALMARDVLRHAGAPFEAREGICAIIAAHQVPFWLYERDEADRWKKAIGISLEVRPSLLLIHARADARGRVCRDREELLLGVDLAEAVFEELGILHGPYPFANDESRVAYMSRDDRHPSYEAFEDHRSVATVMSGLPGSGKDSWIARNAPDLPVVSLDSLREEMDVDPRGNQGAVVQAAYEAAREHLRAGRDFVWNATNVTSDMRSRIVRLLRDYDARVRMVYVEVPPLTLRKQNADRRAAVDPAVIDRLARKLEPPKPWEAHDLVRAVETVEREARPRRVTQVKPGSVMDRAR